jgi:hypothetical protein
MARVGREFTNNPLQRTRRPTTVLRGPGSFGAAAPLSVTVSGLVGRHRPLLRPLAMPGGWVAGAPEKGAAEAGEFLTGRSGATRRGPIGPPPVLWPCGNVTRKKGPKACTGKGLGRRSNMATGLSRRPEWHADGAATPVTHPAQPPPEKIPRGRPGGWRKPLPGNRIRRKGAGKSFGCRLSVSMHGVWVNPCNLMPPQAPASRLPGQPMYRKPHAKAQSHKEEYQEHPLGFLCDFA